MKAFSGFLIRFIPGTDRRKDSPGRLGSPPCMIFEWVWRFAMME